MKTLSNIFPKRKRSWILLILSAVFMFALISCGPTKLTIAHANLKPNGHEANPPLLTENTTREHWEHTIRPQLLSALQDHVYGYLPTTSSVRVVNRKTLDTQAYNGQASIEEYTLIATATYGQITNQTAPFKMVLVTPNIAPALMPVILMESFCPNHNTINHPEVSKATVGYSCDGNKMMNGVMNYVFGRYIATPPMEMILDHGYAFATIFPSEYVPDSAAGGQVALKNLSKGHTNPTSRLGAIAAWGWGYSRMIDVLEKDTRFSDQLWIPYGHSRYGKAALLAGAFDERISAVIAHQSGTGGASLNKYKKGETVEEITDTFPHWFSKSYAGFSDYVEDMPIDQHALLALNAPKPIFLGNARRDVWSDPNGAFRAAQGASPAYRLYNKQGLAQEKLKPFDPHADISFYIRPGTHGVVKEDWPAFLAFLDAHLKN